VPALIAPVNVGGRLIVVEQRGINMKMMVDAGANPETLEFLSLLVLLLSRPVSRSSRLIGGGLGQLRTLRLINDMFYHTPPRPWEIGSPRLSPVPSSCPGYCPEMTKIAEHEIHAVVFVLRACSPAKARSVARHEHPKQD
jgi:hypothetical protein